MCCVVLTAAQKNHKNGVNFSMPGPHEDDKTVVDSRRIMSLRPSDIDFRKQMDFDYLKRAQLQREICRRI
jgi:hypothetical protein